MDRTLAPLGAAIVLLTPAVAHAHGSGMGTAIVGTLWGLLTGLVLLALTIVSAILGGRTADPRPGRARYGHRASIASIVLAAVQIVLVALIGFLDLRQDTAVKGAATGTVAALLVFGAPVLVLAVASFLTARRVVRNHTPSQAPAKE